jgi:molybdate transport system substrate-binding protein
VASNFTEPAKEIATIFEQTTGNRAVLSFGSTGQFVAQVMQDAPFEVFLSADEAGPRRLVDDGFAVADSLFTYAIGRIALFSTTLDLTEGDAVLRAGDFEKIAVANPSIAPYGAAAIETMKALGVDGPLNPRIVQGNNISQTFQFVETGSAEIGFVALSQVIGRQPSSIWIVPDNLYRPIRQDAVLLKKGTENDVARTFVAFLKSMDVIKIIEKYGYRV